MLNAKDLKFDPASLGNKLILCDIVKNYGYVDGHKTENIIGYKYVVALPEHGLEKLSVKIDGDKLLEFNNEYPCVNFENLELSLYVRDNVAYVSAKATGISIAE